MGSLKRLENTFDNWFVKKAPPITDNTKHLIVKYLPGVCIVLGLLTLESIHALWHWAHVVNSLINATNIEFSSLSGPAAKSFNQLNFGIWLALITLTLEAALYIAAFVKTRERKNPGLDLLYYALLLNLAYGVIIFFTNYGGLGTLIEAVISTGIGLYLLFQIKSSYLSTNTPTKPRARAKKTR